MRQPSTAHRVNGIFWLAALLAVFSSPMGLAETVYKCVTNGRVIYTSAPPQDGSQCQETIIRDSGPSPDDLARILEEKKLRQEAQRQAEEADLKEREIRAREIEAAAADRRARAAEEELLLLRQAPSSPAPDSYQLIYPYWWGPPAPVPRPPPGGWRPGRPVHPGTPPRPQPVPPTGAVRVR